MARRSRKKKAVVTPGLSEVRADIAWAPHPRSFLQNEWFLGGSLILFVILAYVPVWWAGFVWDDDTHLTANPWIIGPLGLKQIWTTSLGQVFPLVFTAFWVEHAIWGLAPLPYHLVNVFEQALSAILLWQVLQMLRVPGAWLGAALWALHPLQVESVAWISEMKNTQSGVFFLLTILFFLRWLTTDGNPRKRNWDYVLTLLCATLAMASKTSTLVLPVVLGLCAWWVEGRWHWRRLLPLLPIMLMALLAVVVTMGARPSAGAVTPDFHPAASSPERLIITGDAIWFYLGKLLWPYPLMAIYPRWTIDAGQWWSYLPLVIALGGLLVLWLKRDSWGRPYCFALAYFLVALSPFVGLVDQSFWRYSFVEDHLQQLAGMGPLALLGAGMVRMAHAILPEKPWLQSGLYAALLLILGALSWQRACVYQNQETLWTDALAKNPGCWAAYNNLGTLSLASGNWNEALGRFQAALKLNPNYAEAENNLGFVYLQLGQFDAAMAHCQRALEISPSYEEAENNLGLALFRRGQLDEAIIHYRRALALDDLYVDAHYNLGLALYQKEAVDEAIAQYRKALEINPGKAEAHCNLGCALLAQGHADQAITEFQKARELIPDNLVVRYNFGLALLQTGRIDEAIVEFQKTLEIDPNFAPGHFSLGQAFYREGRVDEAIAQFQEVLRLNHHDPDAQANLAKLEALKAQKEAHP